MPSCGVLSQEHCFDQAKIKVDIEFENGLRCCDELESLGKPSYYITVISEGQTPKVRKHSQNTSPKVKWNIAKNHEFR